MYELVLLQILAALSDVSGHVEKVHHGQAGWVLLIQETRGNNMVHYYQREKINHCKKESAKAQCSGFSHQPGSGLPQEGLEVSSCHQLQQDEPGHGLQTHSYAAHDVLVAELTAGTDTQQGNMNGRDRLLMSII